MEHIKDIGIRYMKMALIECNENIYILQTNILTKTQFQECEAAAIFS